MNNIKTHNVTRCSLVIENPKQKSQYYIGQCAEDTACAFLQKEGLKLFCKNYRCRMGEIDLIMLEKDFYVFVEVRSRSDKNYGDSIESVSYFKQKKLIKTATYFLQTHDLYDKVFCRFDVVGIDLSQKNKIQWIRNAIYVK